MKKISLLLVIALLVSSFVFQISANAAESDVVKIRLPFDSAKLSGNKWGKFASGGGGQYHIAEDYVSVKDGKVYACADGVVKGKWSDSKTIGCGLYIQHTINGETFCAEYGHITNIPDPLKKVGAPVKCGDLLGYVCQKKDSKKPGYLATFKYATHLHWSIKPGAWKGGKWYAGSDKDLYYSSPEAVKKAGFVNPSDYIKKKIK